MAKTNKLMIWLKNKSSNLVTSFNTKSYWHKLKKFNRHFFLPFNTKIKRKVSSNVVFEKKSPSVL